MSVMCTAVLSLCASAAGPSGVSRFGFCVAESDGRCVEVALPDAVLEYESLVEDEGGRRYMLFYSSLPPRRSTVLVHLLFDEDQDQSAQFVTADSGSPESIVARANLAEMARQCAGSGSAVVTVFRAVTGSPAESFAFSKIDVSGPGQYSGCVATIDGAAVTSTAKVVLSVIRRAAAAG